MNALRLRLCGLLHDADLRGVQFALCVAACIMAAGYWIEDSQCNLRACLYLENVMPWQWWGVLWTIYASLKTWANLTVHRPTRIMLIVNAAGAFLFSAVAVGTTIARWPALSVSAFGITFSFLACWVLVRTAINPRQPRCQSTY